MLETLLNYFSAVPAIVGTILLILCMLAIAVVVSVVVSFQGLPRCSGWTVISACLLFGVGIIAPQNLPVVLYKLSLVTVAAVLGYSIDRTMYPYARPHHFMHALQVASIAPQVTTLYAATMIRRAIVLSACILGVTLGM